MLACLRLLWCFGFWVYRSLHAHQESCEGHAKVVHFIHFNCLADQPAPRHLNQLLPQGKAEKRKAMAAEGGPRKAKKARKNRDD